MAHLPDDETKRFDSFDLATFHRRPLVRLKLVSVEYKLAHNDGDEANDDQKWQQ